MTFTDRSRKSAGANVVLDQDRWDDATNPVLAGFRPDPSVCRVDEPDGTAWYYSVNSTFEYLPGLPVHRSRDLVTWELVGNVVSDQLDYAGAYDSGGLYAPTIRHDGERFIVVCTHLRDREGARGNFVMTATDPAGAWSAPIWWTGSDGVDPSVLIDDDGRWWACGAREARPRQWEGHGEVWVREIDPETLGLIGDEHVVWRGAAVGATWPEGPHLYRRGAHVYLLAAEGGTGRHHAVCVARASSPVGPFESHADNPVLTHRHLGPGAAVVNVGHADLVEAPDGRWWALALASRLVDGHDLLGRESFLVPVAWHDDWPVFAPGEGTLVPEPSGDVTARSEPVTPWLAVRQLPAAVAPGIRDDDEIVTIAARTGDSAPPRGMSADVPRFVGKALRHLHTEVSVTLPAPGPDDEIGIALRQSSSNWLAVLRRDGRLSVLRCVAGTLIEGASVAADRDGIVTVSASGPRAQVRWQPAGAEPVILERTDIAHLSTTSAGGFVGVIAGVYAESSGDTRIGPVHFRRASA